MISWLCGRLVPSQPPPLTWRAQWVLHAAIRHAERRGVARAGAVDLLYGLARADEGVGRTMLAELGVPLDDLVPPGEEPIPTSRRPPVAHPGRWAKDAETVRAWARAEAARAGHRYIGTEHLVLGLLHRGAGDVCRLLRGRGASLPQAREAMSRIIGEGAE